MFPRKSWSAKVMFSSLVRLIGSRRGSRPLRTRLLAEALEDRTAPATFSNIDPTLADGAPLSLRADITTANGNTDTMEIFTLDPGTFTVSSPGDLQLTGAGKTYVFEQASPGGGTVTIDAASQHRVFEVLANVTAMFEGLTITGGLAIDGGSLGGMSALGGGILNNSGNVTLQNVILSNNKALGAAGVNGTNPVSFGVSGQAGQGGGLYSSGGTLSINDSQIQGNMAVGGAGAMGGAGNAGQGSSAPGGSGGVGQGGGLYAIGGTLAITNSSSITNNQATGGAGGLGGNATNRIVLHQAGGVGGAGQGGGLYTSDVNIMITGNSISSNKATGGLGGPGFNHSDTSGSGGAGGAGGIGQGGGLYASGGTLAISSGTTFADNQALGSAGGAGGKGSEFNAGGAGGSGGDAQGGGLYLTDSSPPVLSTNSPADSSALTATLDNTTLSGNIALGGNGMNGGAGGGTDAGAGGGLGGNGGDAQGGGLFTSAASVTISDSTVGTMNQAQAGNGGLGGPGGNANFSTAGNGGDGGLGGAGQGGGIYTAGAVLAVTTTTVASNAALGGQGGAGGAGGNAGTNRFSESGTLIGGTGGQGGLGGNGQGGGLNAGAGTLTTSDTTIALNNASGGTGGAGGTGGVGPSPSEGSMGGTGGNGGAGGNGGSSQGGGVFTSLGSVTLANTTIALNTASASTGGAAGAGGAGGTVDQSNPGAQGEAGMAGAGLGGQGGGVANAIPSDPAVDLESTLIATNTVVAGPSSGGPDVFGGFTTTSFHNLIGIGDGSTGLSDTRTTMVPSDAEYEQVGTSTSPIAPDLGSLANNGGPTMTMALQFGSPAIDAGANPNNLADDQRGPPFIRDAGPQTDVGAYEVQVANLSGFVYVDSNGTGSYVSTDPGIANVTVTLTGTNEFGVAVNTSAMTASNGMYTFASVYASNSTGYTITVTPPSGYFTGAETVGSVGGTAAASSFTGVVLNEDADGVNYNFGYLLPASLSGYVYLDKNNNGIKDPGEPGIPNVTVTLTGVQRQFQTGGIQPDVIPVINTSVTTDTNGFYSFTNLVPGTYTITETHPSGYVDGKDTIGTPGGTTGTDQFSNIVLNPGVAGANNNFGELNLGILSGFVYLDTSSTGFNDGIKEAGEQGVAGVNVYLIGTNANGPVSTFTTTAADGSYTFANLLPGAYAIIKGPTPTLLDGKDAVGSQGGRMIENEIYNIGVAGNTNGINNNFGELTPNTLSGHVYLDSVPPGVDDTTTRGRQEGLAGEYVYLIGSNDQGPVSTFTTTDANGLYTFNNLRPGAYAVIKGPTPSLLDDLDTIGTQGGKTIQNEFYNIGLTSGVSGINNDFGELAPNALSGYVYLDTAPTDGIKEADEQGVAGVSVYLIGMNDQGAVSQSTVTDANGFYSFGNLRPGAYAIVKGATPDYVDGIDTLGSQGGNKVQDELFNIGLTSGINGVNNNFGLDGLIASLVSKTGFLASTP